jgi:hypothetical protein
MRVGCALLWIIALSGCSKSAAPAASSMPAPAQGAHADEPVERPSRPTPAFLSRDQGRCAPAYKLIGDTCVHRYYEQNAADELEQKLAAYKRGAAPPMLGVGPARTLDSAPVRRALDPGALVRREAFDAGPGGAKERRLAELDVMLEAAREKLRERDAAGKAKHVDNAPRRQPAPEGDAATAPGMLAGATDAVGARLRELSQLATQLGSEQLRALSSELARSGIDTSALDQALGGSQAGQTPPP